MKIYKHILLVVLFLLSIQGFCQKEIMLNGDSYYYRRTIDNQIVSTFDDAFWQKKNTVDSFSDYCFIIKFNDYFVEGSFFPFALFYYSKNGNLRLDILHKTNNNEFLFKLNQTPTDSEINKVELIDSLLCKIAQGTRCARKEKYKTIVLFKRHDVFRSYRNTGCEHIGKKESRKVNKLLDEIKSMYQSLNTVPNNFKILKPKFRPLYFSDKYFDRLIWGSSSIEAFDFLEKEKKKKQKFIEKQARNPTREEDKYMK